MSSALVLVDVQNDFITGVLRCVDGPSVVSACASLLPGYATLAFTQDYHPPHHVSFAAYHNLPPFSQGPDGTVWPAHCVAGTWGAEFALPLPPGARVFRKGTHEDHDSYSGCCEQAGVSSGLVEYLREQGVAVVDLCGVAAEYCVLATARDLVQAGFTVRVLAGAVGWIDPGRKEEITEEWKECGAQVV